MLKIDELNPLEYYWHRLFRVGIPFRRPGLEESKEKSSIFKYDTRLGESATMLHFSPVKHKTGVGGAKSRE